MTASEFQKSNDQQSPVRLQPVVSCVEVSCQLKDNLTVMKRMIGDKWEASAEEYRTVVRGIMIATNDRNPIACALPMAQEMSKRGHSPLMLMAVATEMSEEANDQAPRPGTKGAPPAKTLLNNPKTPCRVRRRAVL